MLLKIHPIHQPTTTPGPSAVVRPLRAGARVDLREVDDKRTFTLSGGPATTSERPSFDLRGSDTRQRLQADKPRPAATSTPAVHDSFSSSLSIWFRRFGTSAVSLFWYEYQTIFFLSQFLLNFYSIFQLDKN